MLVVDLYMHFKFVMKRFVHFIILQQQITYK